MLLNLKIEKRKSFSFFIAWFPIQNCFKNHILFNYNSDQMNK